MDLTDTIHSVLSSKLADNSVLIFGLGSEGYSTYQTVRAVLPDLSIIAIDDKTKEQLASEWQSALQSDQLLQFCQTKTPLSEQVPHLQSHLLVIKTPGIPFSHPFFAQLQALEDTTISYSSNVELFFDILTAIPEQERPQTIGITGTKGKSTTTALIHHVLKESGKAVFLAGNIGVPALELLGELQSTPELAKSFVVLELSSHQLQNLPYSPHIAVAQNVTPEHLDYYANFAEYVQAKAAIAAHQTARDYIIFNPDYEIPRQFALSSPAQQLPYSLTLEPQTTESEDFLQAYPGIAQVVAFRKEGQLFYETEAVCAQTDLPLQGEHNVLNTFPAIIVGKLIGISTEELVSAIKSFKSLPHRLEYVTEKQGVQYFNDSQGTTPEASIAAMRSFPGKEIVLLAGGSEKGVSFTDLAQEILRQDIKHILLFPPTGSKIEAAVREAFRKQQESQNDAAHQNNETTTLPQFYPVESMPAAVQLAAEVAQPGAVVLLSPACASFGLFKNYQDRGNQFKEAAQSL